jgi:iron complex transport system substrate-binding protein
MKRKLLSATLVAFVLFAACSEGKQASGDTTPATVGVVATTIPAAVDAPSTSTLPAADRIVSLSPTATEMLFAIGAGDNVLAVDDQSNYPAEALAKPHDLSALEPDVDAIAALQPDLVVIADDSDNLTQQLEAAGLTVWKGPPATSFDNVYEQIEQLGTITGHVADAAALVAKMHTDIDTTVAATPQPPQPLTYYHEIDNTFRSVTENTFIGQVYSLFGLQSVADFQEVDSDYPQLAEDEIISTNPDFIFLADGGESAATVAARPGWGNMKAVTNGNVVVLDPAIASRWGPRLVDFVAAVSDAVNKSVG